MINRMNVLLGLEGRRLKLRDRFCCHWLTADLSRFEGAKGPPPLEARPKQFPIRLFCLPLAYTPSMELPDLSRHPGIGGVDIYPSGQIECPQEILNASETVRWLSFNVRDDPRSYHRSFQDRRWFLWSSDVTLREGSQN